MEQTRGAQKASMERLLVLKARPPFSHSILCCHVKMLTSTLSLSDSQEVNTYLEGVCVEPCIQSQLQHFLNSLCAECCKAWAHKAHNTDARARYRTSPRCPCPL